MFLIVDAHADVFSRSVEEGLDYIDEAGRFQASFAHLRLGGVGLQWASIFTPAALAGAEATNEALRIVGVAHEAARRLGTRIVTKPDDLTGLGSTGPRFLLSMEGASPLAGSVARLHAFVDMGLRVLGLTHNHDNECGDGCFAREPAGLTAVGRDILAAARVRGVLLDVAHLNRRSFDEVLAAESRPVVYSHGASRALVDVPRNLTDAQARAVAATGGVLGVDFYPGHVSASAGGAAMSDVLDHLCHWIDLVGAAHVGLGGDFDGIPSTPRDMPDARVYPALMEGLRARGVPAADLPLIAGGNWLRVLAPVLARVLPG